jgi:flagellin
MWNPNSRRKIKMRINHNIAALNTHRQLNSASGAQSKSMEKLSSGLRINRAGDDAAGLAISEKMRGQIRGLDQASRNAQDGISLIQTTEGALNETHSILQRMRELAVQSSNDTNTDTDRKELQKEVNQLASEISRIGDNTEFNTKNLLDGSFEGTFQIGANEGQNLTLGVNDMRAGALNVINAAAITSVDAGTTNLNSVNNAGLDILVTGSYTTEVTAAGGVTLKDSDGTTIGTGTLADGGTDVTITVSDTTKLVDPAGTATFQLGISDTDATVGIATQAGTISIETVAAGDGGININTQANADTAITKINSAIETVSAERSKLGATQNRLEHTINNLGTSAENLTAAESRVRDVDMAKEMMTQTKNSILSQAAQAMLAQSNQMPQGVLQLLR